MIETLDALDKQLMLLLNYDGGAGLDQLWWFVSGKLTWVPLYLYLLARLIMRCKPLKLRWREFTYLLLITILVVVLCDQISSGMIKPWVMRPRPSQPDSGISDMLHLVNDFRASHYGFVSSHAANTWGISLWFILLFKRPVLTYVLILFTLLNCYSRIYLGVHYPGDILGGLLVGTFVAICLYYVLLPLANKWFIDKK